MTTRTGNEALAERVAAAIRRHQAGDADAMAELFRATRPWLCNIALACRLSSHSADDVLQSTMAAALTHLPGLRNPDAGLAWLSVIARREAIRVSREERRSYPLGDGPVDDADDPERLALTRAANEALMHALAHLPERERKLLTFLFFDEGRNYASIASELQMPIGSIGPTRQRGLKKVRTLMSQDGEDKRLCCAC
jgi:RNA polymerase sigma factor (sigma-70 family)